jgi:hypothetical protein
MTKQEVVARLEGRDITVLGEETLYYEVRKVTKIKFRGYEFLVDKWSKSDADFSDYDNNMLVKHNGVEVQDLGQFNDEFLDSLYDAIDEELE